MPLEWAPGLARSQVVRRAAKILALNRAIAGCGPHEWRLHILAQRYLEALAGVGSFSGQVVFAMRQLEQIIIQLDRSEPDRKQPAVELVVLHLAKDGPCIHSVPDTTALACHGRNLLKAPEVWTDPQRHGNLQWLLRLDGWAASAQPGGPWQGHDRRSHAILRAAYAALACEAAYIQTLQRDPPFILHTGNMLDPDGLLHMLMGRTTVNTQRNTLRERFVKPWRERFQNELDAQHEIQLDGKEFFRRFRQEGESHWTLELCWAIVLESYRIRLDCPPLVVPLETIRQRGDRSPMQAILQFLIDDQSGPRIPAKRAAEFLGLNPHAVDQQLSEARRSRPPDPEDDPRLPWNPLPIQDDLLVPTAMHESPPGRANGPRSVQTADAEGGEQ